MPIPVSSGVPIWFADAWYRHVCRKPTRQTALEGSRLEPFRLAHLSDPHLALALPRGREWLGKRGLSALNWYRRRARLHRVEIADRLVADLQAAAPDAIAVTGDVVNFALPREFAAARAWLDRLGPPDRVLVVPGNHEALAGAWAAEMAQAWGPYAPGLPRLTRHVDHALIQLSSACVTPPFLAGGRLAEPGAARRMLAKAVAAGLCPIVLMHHPPIALTARRKGLADLDGVQAALGQAALVLHGHTHGAELGTFPGVAGAVPVVGVPSLSMVPGGRHPAGAWRLFEFTGAHVTMTERAITSGGDVTARTPTILTLPCHAGGDQQL